VTILAGLVAFAAVLALWGARRAGSATEYFVAGRRAGPWLVGVAGTAAGVSAFTFVGGPGLFAVVGVGSLWLILSAPLTGALQCWGVGERLAALAAKRPILTVPELVEARFGAAARGTTAAVLVLGCVAALAVQARATAVLGEAFLGLPGVTVAAAVMLATVLYTAAGGMRAGLVADAAQGVVMGGFAVALAVAALAAAGGAGAALGALQEVRPELLGAFGRTAPATAMAWYLLFCLGTLAQPHYLQKFLFLRSPAAMRSLPAVLTAALAVTLTVWLGVGLAGTALAARGAIAVQVPDALTPAVVNLLGPGWVAVAAVAVLAAMMSTSASFLNLAAAAVTRDLPASLGRSQRGLATARVATVVVAVAATLVGVGSDRAVALLGVAGWGFFTAALLPVLTVGLAWRGARPGAVVAAMTAGAALDLALELFRQQLPAGLEPGLAGAALGTLVLVAGSAAAPQRGLPDPGQRTAEP